MKTIVEFFDPDAVNNLIELLIFCPQKVVFIYDRDTVSDGALDALERACRMAVPGLSFFRKPARFDNRQDLLAVCRDAVDTFPEVCVDLTGGGELAAVCAYEVCKERGVPLLQVDIRTGRIIPIHGNSPSPVSNPPPLTLELLLATRGAALGGSAHGLPPREQFPAYARFMMAVLRQPEEWKALCRYIQTGCNQYKTEEQPLYFSAPKQIVTADNRSAEVVMPLLDTARQAGLIRHAAGQDGYISFVFADNTAKQYLTDFGIWLEFFCYHELIRAPRFSDVHMSLRVAWHIRQKSAPTVLNEIDAACMCAEKPVFISCKLSEPGVDALYELSMYARYFGGVTSKCVLVVLAAVNPNGPLAARAKEMDILILSGDTLLSGHFLHEIQATCGGAHRE